MFSIFFHLLFIGYATVEFRGDLSGMPVTGLCLWLFLTFVFILRSLPIYVENAKKSDDFPAFGKGQMIQQWSIAIWIVLLHVVSDPGKLFFPDLINKFPETIPMLISVVIYVAIYRLTANDIRNLYQYYLNEKQTAYEFFRARMTFPILFFPPMIIWMAAEDLFQQNPEFAEVQDMQTFIIAPLFFIALYILSPKLFNWAWHANPSENKELEQDIIDISEKSGTPVSGVKVWDTFNESIPNAAVAGLFKKYRYVYITNYLLELFNPSQVKSVLAHELGHLRLGHIWTYMIFSLDVVLLSVGTKMSIYLNAPYLLSGHEIISSVLEIVIFLALFVLVFTAIARTSEYQADAFAATITNKDDLADGLLTLENIVTPMLSVIPEWVKTHPEISNRVKSIRNWNGSKESIIKKAQNIRYGLIIAGIIILVFSLPALKTMWKVIQASSFRQSYNFEKALSILDSLPPSLDYHPMVSREIGRVAFSSNQWLTALASAANSYWNIGFSAKVFLEILHHSTAPKVTFYFKFMKFLL